MKTPRLKRFGDELPPEAVARFGTARWRHGGPGAMPCWSPEGALLVTAVWNRVDVWDGRSGVHQRALPMPPTPRGGGTLSSVTALADGTFVMIASGQVNHWNAHTGERLRTIEGSIHHGAVSPDGSLLAALDAQGIVQRWDLRDGRALAPLTRVRLDTWALLVFTPDGRSMLVARRDGALIARIDAQTGALEATLARDTPSPCQIAPSRDGAEVLVAFDDGPLRRFSLRDGRERSPLDAPLAPSSFPSVVAMRDGSWLCACNQTLVRRHPDETSARWRRDDLAPGVEIAVSPDDRVVAVGGSGALRRYDALTGERFEEHGHTGWVDESRVARDGSLVSRSTSCPPELLRWRSDGGEPEVISRALDVAPMSLSPDGELVAVLDRAQTLRVLPVDGIASTEPLITVEQVRAVTMLPGGRVLYSRPSGTFVLDLSTRGEATLPESWEHLAGVSRDGSLLALQAQSLVVRRASDSSEVTRMKPVPALACAAFADDHATLVTLSRGDGLRAWDVATGAPRGKLLRVLPKGLDGRRLECFAMTRDGSFALIGDDHGDLHGADLAARRACALGSAHRGGVRAIEFEEDHGVARTSGADTAIIIWDLDAIRARVTPAKNR